MEERALETDEGVVERSVSLDLPFFPNFDSADRGVECVGTALEQLHGKVIAGTEPAFDGNDEGEETFVDVVGGQQRD